MTTIKAYTDLSQSKALSKILPLESADMFYIAGKGEPIFIGNKMVAYGDDDYDALGGPDVLCWSLAALLDVLPDHFYDKTGRKTLGMDKGDTYYNIFYENKNSYIQKSADNPVDACVVMIERLHELNLL